MSAKSVIGILVAMIAGGIVYPLAAQQGATPSSPSPTPGQPAQGAVQPTVPSQPAKPIPSPVPVTPRRIPAPVAPGAGAAQNVPPSDKSDSSQIEQPSTQQQTPAPQAGPAPSLPGRRSFAPTPLPSGGMVSLNFNRADLVEIIHIIAQQLRLTYTIDPEVKGTVTINSAEPLRAEDLLPVFHQLLRMNGAVAVRTGNLYHIMPIKDGKGLARPVGQSREDSFALQIIPVRFFSVAEMKKVLTPFIQPGAEIVENPRGNFLIVMDLPSNIQRLMEIADMIDVQVFAGTRMEIYQPKIASAEELALEMTKVMQSFAASAPQADSFTAQFIALPRINQLLVISHSETAWTYAKRWLDRIDVVAEGPGRRIFIYPVENGKATELADVLNQALGQAAAATRSSAPTLQSLHRATPAGMSQQSGIGYPPSSLGPSGFSNQQRGATGSSFGSAFATVPVPGQVTPPVATPQPQATPVAPGAPRSAAQGGPTQTPPPEQLRIVPDPATNSLIIYGTAQEFQNIKNILKDLDAIPRQVLIEALILQVDLKDTEDFGVDYQILTKSRQTIFGQTFGSNAAITTLGKLLPAAPIFSGVSGLSAIVGDDTVSALIRAAATDSRIKLLSSPSVLASDNRPARIQVGSEEPIPTGTVQSPASSGTITSSTTIQYRNTGRILTIIPQVNSQGLVNLQIKAEVSARGDNITVGQDSFPVFNTQDAETSAVVHDGETLVIGGLIGERKSRGRSGVPYLMDIPVIGRFFGSTSDSNERTELIMLITPRVVRNRDESRFATAEFKSKLSAVRNELERMAREREKSQPLPRPEDLPPMPVPPANDQSPNAAPSQTPPGRGASAAPPAGSAAAQPNGTPGKAGNEVPTAARQSIATPPRLNRPIDSFPMQPGGGQVDQEQHSPPPAYALSIVKENLEKPTETVTKPIEAASKTTTTRIWTVQVAAVNLIKDAEGLAGQLRREGYDAYVVTAQIDSKTWHRVRVGQLPRLKEAVELKKVLASSTQFKGSYVAAR